MTPTFAENTEHEHACDFYIHKPVLVSCDCDSCAGRLILGGTILPSARRGAAAAGSSSHLSFVRTLALLETLPWFSQRDGSFPLATWASYTPSDTLWVSWQSVRPGQQFHLLPETSLCCLWHLISLCEGSVGVPSYLNVLGLPCVRLPFSPLWTWKTTKLSFHQTLEEANAQLK